MGETWNKFKMTLVTHKEATQILFDKMSNSIYAGLVEVAEEAKENDDMDYNFAGQNMTGNKWICTRCKTLNDPQEDYERQNCTTCYTKRDPKTKEKVIVPKNTNLRNIKEERKQAVEEDDPDYETPNHILQRVRAQKGWKGKGKKGKKKK